MPKYDPDKIAHLQSTLLCWRAHLYDVVESAKRAAMALDEPLSALAQIEAEAAAEQA